MRALVKSKPEFGFTLEEIPEPKIGENDVLIQVKLAAICGTDLHIEKWDPWAQKNVPLGTTVGHEFVGEIVELGRSVPKHLQKGMRVTGEGHITCGHCRNCQLGKRHLCSETKVIGIHMDGCFAEFICLPAANVFPIPESTPDEVAAIFDPFGNAVHAALSFPLIGEEVLIVGSGPIGMMATAIAAKAGARKITVTDLSDERLLLAKKMGATEVINVGTTPLEGRFSVGLEMSGNGHAFADMLPHMRRGGHVALLGILPSNTLIDWDQVIFKMLKIKGIFGREIFATWHKMLHLLESGLDLTPIITHRYSATEFNQAFTVFRGGKSGKVLLDWDLP